MSMIPWDPMSEMVALRDATNRLSQDSFVRPRSWKAVGREASEMIPLDIREQGDNLIVEASVPDVKPEELDIRIQGNILILSGERKQESERKERNYHLRELQYGRFERTVTLPCFVLADQAEAVFQDGVLTLTVPQAEGIRGKKIKIRVKK